MHWKFTFLHNGPVLYVLCLQLVQQVLSIVSLCLWCVVSELQVSPEPAVEGQRVTEEEEEEGEKERSATPSQPQAVEEEVPEREGEGREGGGEGGWMEVEQGEGGPQPSALEVSCEKDKCCDSANIIWFADD